MQKISYIVQKFCNLALNFCNLALNPYKQALRREMMYRKSLKCFVTYEKLQKAAFPQSL